MVHQDDVPGAPGLSADSTFLFEQIQMRGDRRGRRESKPRHDIAKGGRRTAFLDAFCQKREDLSLFVGQCDTVHVIGIAAAAAESSRFFDADDLPGCNFPAAVVSKDMDFDREKVGAAVRSLAQRNVYIGTSSWKFEGWVNQLYDPARYQYRGKFAKTRFDAGSLQEYAETFKCVCVDASFYRFPDPEYVGKLAVQVPDGFRLAFKVTEEITVKHFPQHARYGHKAGTSNLNFFNAELFEKAFLAPLIPHRDKVGVLMFEFGHFFQRDFEHGRDFVSALDSFLATIPAGWQYGVEIRNPSFLQPEYFDVLRRHGVAHVFNSWTAMPGVGEQMAMPGSFTAEHFAARFLLKPGRKYDEAVKEFSPYEQIKEEVPDARDAMKELTRKRTKKDSYIFVNNRLEGNSLATIAAVVGEAGKCGCSSRWSLG